MTPTNQDELRKIYDARFGENVGYRRKVWDVLVRDFFQRYVPLDARVLDLGCGYGEFINVIRCREKFGMDLNPDAATHLSGAVKFLEQDCSLRWLLDDSSLDVIFTSNFLEHLPDKAALGRTLDKAFRCLAPGGILIAMGPNLRYLPGKYWDFWDHHVALTDKSLGEGLASRGFEIVESIPRFLPYTMVNQRQYSMALLKFYLQIPLGWRIFGRQFLLVARKPQG